jgi:hypothetical protein
MYHPHGLLIRLIKFLHSASDSFAKSILNAPIQIVPVAVIPDRITDESIAFQSARVHPSQHQYIGIDVIVDLDDTLRVMKPVETSDVLLQRSLPRNRYRQEECIQASVIEAFAYVTAGRQNDSWLALRHVRQARPVPRRSGWQLHASPVFD